MKTILLPTHPKYCYLTYGTKEKTEEIRKTAPEPPFKVLSYCTNKNGLFYRRGHSGEIVFAPRHKDNENIRNLRRNNGHQIFNGKIIGEFIVEKVDDIDGADAAICKTSCLSMGELYQYAKGKNLKALHITAPWLYDRPRELGGVYAIKECVPTSNPFGGVWTWDNRHKRQSASLPRASWGVPIECYHCPNLYVAKGPYLDEKSGCMLFDYGCKTRHHRPIARAPQSWMYIQDPEETEK